MPRVFVYALERRLVFWRANIYYQNVAVVGFKRFKNE